MATFGGRETDRAFLSLELRVHRCKTVKVMVTKKESLDELSRKFESKKIFLSQLGNELGKVLKGGDQSTKESRNSAKLMNSYLYSYPDMLNCFENLFTRCAQDVKEDGENSQEAVDDWSKKKSDLIGALFMVYGWMPTTMRLNSGEEPDPEKLKQVWAFLSGLSKEEANDILSTLNRKQERLETLKEMMGDSIVGLSKFMHFLKPSVFPMYDSNIASILGHNIKAVSNYITYTKSFHAALGRLGLSKVRYLDADCCPEDWKGKLPEEIKTFEQKFHYSMTPVRAMEFILFQEGREEKKKIQLEKSRKKKSGK